jgi:uncharacterized RDD family membrane protein YckC
LITLSRFVTIVSHGTEIMMVDIPIKHLDADVLRADFGSRLVASVIDVLLCVVVPFFVFGLAGPFLPGVLGDVWILAVPVSVVVYSVVTGMRGRSPGLKAGNMSLVVARTDRPPGVVRSGLLGIERLIGAAAGVGTVVVVFSDAGPPSTHDRDVAISTMFMVLLAITVLGRLWMLVDRQHATLFDRLLGLAVIRNAPVAGPAPPITN